MSKEKIPKANQTIYVEIPIWEKFVEITDKKFMNRSKILNSYLYTVVKELEDT